MEMYLVDYIRTGSLIIAFIALLFVDRRSWITVDAVLNFVVGAALVVAPQYILDFQVRRSNFTHLQALGVYPLTVDDRRVRIFRKDGKICPPSGSARCKKMAFEKIMPKPR